VSFAAVCPIGLWDARPVRTVSICADRLKEEWSVEWQKRLLAASLSKARVRVPLTLYDQAMRNRK
jgi:hypothetical protein